MERNSKLESEITVEVGKLILFSIPAIICVADIAKCRTVSNNNSFVYYLILFILIGFLIASFVQIFAVKENIDTYKTWLSVVNEGRKYYGKTYCDLSHGSYATWNDSESYPVLLEYEGEKTPVSAGIMAPLGSVFSNADCEVYELNEQLVIRVFTEYGYTEISTRKFI